MFKALKVVFSVILAIIIIFIIIYFLPSDIKVKGLQAITGVVPESIKKEVEELVLTPPEKRAKILKELESRLADALKTISTEETKEKISEELKTQIEEARNLVKKLEEKNNDSSLTNMVTSKLADKLIGDGKNDATPLKNTKECLCEL